jgi:hypothetical protein
MAKEKTKMGKLGGLQRFAAPLAANSAELAHMEASRLRFTEQVTRAEEAAARQAVHTAAKQEASQEFRIAVTEGERLANILRLAVKQHFGIRSEKLAEFGLQPFRGRKTKKTDEAPQPATAPATEAASPPAATELHRP